MLCIAYLAVLVTAASAAVIQPLHRESTATPVSHDVRQASATCTGPVVSTPSTFWIDQMDHTESARGYAPELPGYYTYPVYRNVIEYGAVNDGTGDQTAALQNATNDDGQGGNRYSDSGYTIRPAEVFIPSGTYVSRHCAVCETSADVFGAANMQATGSSYRDHSCRGSAEPPNHQSLPKFQWYHGC